MLVTTKKLRLLFVFCLLASSASTRADSGKGDARPWYFQAGSYMHFNGHPDYEGPPWFAGIEYGESRRWLLGFSVFNNSFGQITQYAYVGKTYHPLENHPGFRLKLTGGIAHGYAGERHKTLPIRWGDAWGFAVVPTIGYQKGRLGADIAILSASGLLFLVGYEFH